MVIKHKFPNELNHHNPRADTDCVTLIKMLALNLVKLMSKQTRMKSYARPSGASALNK